MKSTTDIEQAIQWVNYGDVNYMEHGGIFVKKDTKDFPRCFYVVCLFQDQDVEDTWVIQDLYINLENVDWVNWEDIYAFTELNETATDVERVIALIDYYAPENFGDICMVKGRKDVTETLASFDIPLS